MLTKNLSVISRYCHWYMRKMLGESQLSGIDPVILSFLRGKEGTCQDLSLIHIFHIRNLSRTDIKWNINESLSKINTLYDAAQKSH